MRIKDEDGSKYPENVSFLVTQVYKCDLVHVKCSSSLSIEIQHLFVPKM